MADEFVVITRPIRPGLMPRTRKLGECGHRHRTVDTAIRSCGPGYLDDDAWFDVCRVAGDLRPVVKTIGPVLETVKKGSVAGITWTWRRFNRPHEREGCVEIIFERGGWAWEFAARAPSDNRTLRITADWVAGAAWMLAEVAQRDPTAAASSRASALEAEILDILLNPQPSKGHDHD